MELWVHQQIKNAKIIDLQTVNQEKEMFSVPCLIHYEKGILFLYPLRNNDQSYNNVENYEKGSISIEDPSRTISSTILLKGKLKILRSKEKWNTLKEYWNKTYPFLGTYFDLQDRYMHPIIDQGLLSFKPDHITAWENLESEPIEIDLEII